MGAIHDRTNPSVKARVTSDGELLIIGGDVDGSIVTIEPGLTTAMENDSMGMAIYIGYTAAGTAKSVTGWRIQKFTYTNNVVTDIQWADGVSTFTKIWDSRATYTYS